MITARRMAAVDRNAEEMGISQEKLMESSGNAIARTVQSMASPGDRVLLICGTGNNGGDAFVAARFLKDFDVTVRLIGHPELISTDVARANWDAISQSNIDVDYWSDTSQVDLPNAAVIVDAIVGTGVRGALREPAASVARAINDHIAAVLSVDVPSGIDADDGIAAGDMVAADHVITFHDEKPGLPGLSIPVTIADIGIPVAAERFVSIGDLHGRSRDPESHKGDAGRIMIIGGGPYTGAPSLAGMATLRAGADLAFIHCPESIADTVASESSNFIVRPFEGTHLTHDHADELLPHARDADVVVIGPGLGDADETMQGVATILEGFEGKCVVDADALQQVPKVSTDATLVCTPHLGEFERMGGVEMQSWEERMPAVQVMASELDVTILLKGHYDVISDGAEVRVNRTGNPGMTVGGTGDVLAGVTAALMGSDDHSPLEAAAIAAYVTGRAGDECFDAHGYGLLATDVAETIPRALWAGESP